MGQCVIVAIPEENDYVWKVSSEEVPHMTMLFLGEAENISDESMARIAQFLQHVSDSALNRFWMSVDYRGALGESNADVLFFMDNDYNTEMLKQARAFLLQNNDIATAHASAEQFPEWRPHLTLGYPTAPAKPDERDYPGFHGVAFDRVALWVGEFKGPEFRLKDHFYDNAMPHSSIKSDEGYLAHYGTKGMKWGVRNARASNSQRIAGKMQERAGKVQAKAERNSGKLGNGITQRQAKNLQKSADIQQNHSAKLIAKADARYAQKADKAQQKANREAWKKEAGGTEMANKVFQKAAKDFEKTAEIINNDPNYKGKDVTKGLVGRQYQATMNHYFNQHMAQASVDLTLNDQGRAYIYQFDSQTGLMRGTEHKMVDHADGGNMPDYRVELDELGHMISFSPVLELKHYGVKGMRWGVRRRSSDPSPEVLVTQKKAGAPLKAVGGRDVPAHEDAMRLAATRQQGKASGTHALSNDQLQQAIRRMQLEQQYKQLSAPKKSAGRKFAEALLGDVVRREGSKRIDVLAKEDERLQPLADALKNAGKQGGGKKKK